MTPRAWWVEPAADEADAYALLDRDRAWNGYAIADLDEPFRPYAQVALAGRAPGRAEAALLVLRHPAFTALVAHGPAGGVGAALAALGERGELPRQTFFMVRLPHRAALRRFYAEDGHEMLRMVVTRRGFRLPDERGAVAERLAPADLEALIELYRAYPENVFNADQLAGGVFYGVRDAHGRLLATAGTHVLSRRYGIAAVGNVYTRPEARGRGYGQAVTAAVVAELLDGTCREVILNVAADNGPARRVYQRLGFRTRCRYWEGPATRR
ncbi:MAG TPA: GNAT family N-acetyltransferase [Chloroflexota bacterium]|jgi:ribosomal protein S18 acetylase RimI-like enzyme|nr:GNAT family N-acetyltransferase [Chloroflexota bacterium]